MTSIPTAETFAAAPAGSPGDTSHIPGANLAMWLLRTDNHYGNRSYAFASPGRGRRGDGAVGLVDASANGYFGTVPSPPTGGLGLELDHDAVVGNHWILPVSSGSQEPFTFDARTKTPAFDAIANFTSSWGIGFAFNSPSPGTNQGYILNNYSGTRGFIFGLGFSSVKVMWFETVNAAGTNLFEVYGTIGQYAVATWYYYALVFNGTGGTGSTGLTAYQIPLTGSALTLSSVTSNKNTSVNNQSGSTASSSGTSTSAVQLGSGSSPGACRLKSLWVSIGYAPSDNDILAFANNAIV